MNLESITTIMLGRDIFVYAINVIGDISFRV